MPSKNVLKNYVAESVYHVYNRGVEKRVIFLDDRDYKTFLYFLKQYLISPNDPKYSTTNYKGRTFVRKSFHGRVELLAYCLMDNHFHLMLRQKGEEDMGAFMQCLSTSYSLYFNDRYKRVGCLFQGRYKAVLVDNDNYLLHLSRYIHLNPVEKQKYKGPAFVRLEDYSFSSYQEYLGLRRARWINCSYILSLLSSSDVAAVDTYKKFVEYQAKNVLESAGYIIGDLALE